MKKLYLLFISLFFIGCSTNTINITNQNSSFGLETNNNQILVKHKYKSISKYSKYDLYLVQGHNNKYGIISDSDKIILDIIYDKIGKIYSGFAKIYLNGKVGFINEKAKLVLKPQFNKIDDFTEATTLIKHNDKYGCLDKNMTIKIEPTYELIYPLINSYRKTKQNNLWGLVDNKCNTIVQANYEYLELLVKEKKVKVKLNGKIKYIKLKSN